jgi:hypothetical protein
MVASETNESPDSAPGTAVFDGAAEPALKAAWSPGRGVTREGRVPRRRTPVFVRADRAPRPDLIELWGYDPAADVDKLRSLIARFSRLPVPVRAAFVIAGGLVMLAVGDALGWGWVNDLGSQQVATTVLAEAALLVIVFFVVDEAAERRHRREWDRPAASVISGLLRDSTLTRGVFDDCYHDLDSTDAWRAFEREAWAFEEHVNRAQPMLSTTPELADIWSEFAWQASEYINLVRAGRKEIQRAVGEELFERTRDRLRSRNIELIGRLDRYQQEWHDRMVADALAHPAPERYRRAN